VTPKHIAVVGRGLIGASVMLAARRAWPRSSVATFDRGDSLEAAARADVIVLATPVDVIVDIIRHEGRSFSDALVIDTGSTKRAILSAAREAGLLQFVGGHPMAGGASAGPGEARPDLFDSRPWFLIPADHASLALAPASEFVTALGAAPVVMTDDGTAHDRVMAAVSHLPQVVASALMKVAGDAAGEDALDWAGAGLRDTTRLASSAASMWESVLASNAAEIRPLLLAAAKEITEIAGQLEDPEAVRRLFTAANRYRDRLR
jgi:prephenate dehydrogenase